MSQPTSETLEFQIHLRAEFWDLPPGAEILVDGESKFNQLIDAPSHIVTFNHTLKFGEPHQLSVRRYNKVGGQTLVDGDRILDQLLYIDKVVIDKINIRNIVWSQSWNEPEYPEPWASNQRAQGVELLEQVPAETCLGHNSVWRLNFTSPFYRFIMDWMG